MSDLISALRDAYPGITFALPGSDCIVVDDGDGPYIQTWNRAEPKPDEAVILANYGNGASARAKLKDAVMEERKRREKLGVSYVFPDGLMGTIQTRDADDFRNLNGLYNVSMRRYQSGNTESIGFYDAENVQHFMTPAQIMDMCDSVAAFVEALIRRSKAYKEAIDMAQPDLSTIDPVNGW